MRYRKLLLVVMVLALLNISLVHADYQYQYYPTSRQTSTQSIKDNHPSATDISAYGYFFTPGGAITIHTVQWYLQKIGSPKVELYTQIYATNVGTHLPVGAALATSNVINATDLSIGLTLEDFYFNSTERLNMVGGTEYAIVLVAGASGTINGANYVKIGTGSTTGDDYHPRLVYNTGAWSWAGAAYPVYYAYAYNDSAPVLHSYIKTGSSGASSEYQINVTIHDDNEWINLDYFSVQFNVSDDSQYFTLNWTQAGDAFAETADVGGICTLNNAYSTEINYTDIQLTFEFTVSDAAVNGTATLTLWVFDDEGNNDTAAETNFVVSTDYGVIGDIIDTAFEYFGIIDYMSKITTFISGLTGWFATSLTRIIQLLTQEFLVINNVFGFFIYWYAAILNVILTFSTFYQQILNGTSPWIQPLVNLGNIWDLIGYSIWAPAVPMLLFIIWLDSLDKRAAQTVGGIVQVFINDVNTAISITSYFLGVFSYVANTIIDRVYGLFDAII